MTRGVSTTEITISHDHPVGTKGDRTHAVSLKLL